MVEIEKYDKSWVCKYSMPKKIERVETKQQKTVTKYPFLSIFQNIINMDELITRIKYFEKELVAYKFYTTKLAVYNVKIIIKTDNKWLIHQIEKDYSKFLKKVDKSHITIYVLSGKLPFNIDLKKLSSKKFAEFVISHSLNGIIILRYTKRAFVIYDFHNGIVIIYVTSEKNRDYYEMAYLYIESCIGELLEHKRIFRIHAASLLKNGEGILLLGGIGSGKSVTSIMLSRLGAKMLSEDISLLTKDLQILPYPTRAGLNKKSLSILGKRVKTQKIKYSSGITKYLVELEEIGLPIYDKECKLSKILILNPTKLNFCSVHRASTKQILSALIKALVVGLGIPQLREIVFTRALIEPQNFFLKGMKRLLLASKLMLKIEWYTVYMAKKVNETIVAINNFLEKSSYHP
jgi:hypothetical protein